MKQAESGKMTHNSVIYKSRKSSGENPNIDDGCIQFRSASSWALVLCTLAY